MKYIESIYPLSIFSGVVFTFRLIFQILGESVSKESLQHGIETLFRCVGWLELKYRNRFPSGTFSYYLIKKFQFSCLGIWGVRLIIDLHSKCTVVILHLHRRLLHNVDGYVWYMNVFVCKRNNFRLTHIMNLCKNCRLEMYIV